MKKIIRNGTFETNSSSTHSITIMTADKWDEFKKTDKYLADWDGKLYLVDDLITDMKERPDLYKDVDLSNKETCVEYLTGGRRPDYFTYENWGEYDKWANWAEAEVKHFESPSGDKMVAVCTYGYQG